ncbi:MAG TPA: hypothetical protein VJJ22_04160 [Candidatus Paceibacterota bacterium]
MQQNTSLKLFRFIAWFASIYHVVLGLLGTFGNSSFVVSLVNKVYGITVNIDPDLFMSFARFAGSYMIAFGLMMGLIAKNPIKYRRFAWVGVALIIIRLFDRIVFFKALQSTLNISLVNSLPTIIVISLMAIGLVVCMPKDNA